MINSEQRGIIFIPLLEEPIRDSEDLMQALV
jgi:hypothetical protein